MEGSTETAPATGDLLYEAFYGAALGGAAIAIFFLAADTIAGRPLYTPSLLGEVLFTGADPTAVEVVRLEMVAYFSGVHLVAFLLLGLCTSWLCRVTGISKRDLPVVTGVVFLMLTGAFFGGDLLLFPGVAVTIGIPELLLGNFLAAAVMGVFLRKAHADD
ncbi:MAG: hypothetical protein OEN56_01715 [Gemmatimonadota bacterium]|nr:hypothetical protein [Gemmatimonadota bacterium]